MSQLLIGGVAIAALITMYLIGRNAEAKAHKLNMSSAQQVYESILLPKLTTLLTTQLASYQQALAVKDLPADARLDLEGKMKQRVREIWTVFEHPSIEGVDALFAKYVDAPKPMKQASDEESFTPHEIVN